MSKKKIQQPKKNEHNLCNHWFVVVCGLRFHKNTANLSEMNKIGNDFNLSRYVPDGFPLLPETVDAGRNAYEQQRVWTEAESNRPEMDEHLLNANMEISLLFVSTEKKKRERESASSYGFEA